MRVSTLAALMIITTVVLSACSQKELATVDDRSGQFFGRGYGNHALSLPVASSYPPIYPATTGSAYAPAHEANIAPASGGGTAYDTAVTSKDLAAPAPMMAKQSQWIWPVEGAIIKDFATQGEGIVIRAKKGMPIRAALGGEVAYVGAQMKDYGNLVIIRHASGELSSYAHAAEIIVAKGDTVKQGDVLGYVGQTGRAVEPQLHFAIRSGERTIDPATRLGQRLAAN